MLIHPAALVQAAGALRLLKRAEHYIKVIRPGILDEVAQGGIRGSAALVHELTEVDALRAAGLNVYDPDDIGKIVAAFEMARKTAEPKAHVPWHLLALRAEINFAFGKLAARGRGFGVGNRACLVRRRRRLYS